MDPLLKEALQAMETVPRFWPDNRLSASDIYRGLSEGTKKHLGDSTYMSRWEGREHFLHELLRFSEEGHLPKPLRITRTYKVRDVPGGELVERVLNVWTWP